MENEEGEIRCPVRAEASRRHDNELEDQTGHGDDGIRYLDELRDWSSFET